MGLSPPASPAEAPEFSRPIDVLRIGPAGLTLAIEAKADELVRLAERMGVNEVRELSADVRLTQRGAGFAVMVAWRAEIVQECVGTLEPMQTRLKDTAELLFGPSDAGPKAEEVEIDPDAADPPEPIVDGQIDVGEVVAEQLALGIDPYPRKPGAVFDHERAEFQPEPKLNPFAALGGWGKKE